MKLIVVLKVAKVTDKIQYEDKNRTCRNGM